MRHSQHFRRLHGTPTRDTRPTPTAASRQPTRDTLPVRYLFREKFFLSTYFLWLYFFQHFSHNLSLLDNRYFHDYIILVKIFIHDWIFLVNIFFIILIFPGAGAEGFHPADYSRLSQYPPEGLYTHPPHGRREQKYLIGIAEACLSTL